ncbi:cytochrome c [bacterium]|nr:cytochrome c [bacterium]
MRSRFGAIALLAIPGVLAWALCASAASEPNPARQAELRYMVQQDCGSCHGLRFKGGLGPAILPENLKGKSTEALARVILDGVPGTAMPPWRPLLTEDEATWIARLLQKGFTDAP